MLTDLSPTAFYAALAVVAALFVVLTWIITSRLPPVARWVARLVIVVMLATPTGLAVWDSFRNAIPMSETSQKLRRLNDDALRKAAEDADAKRKEAAAREQAERDIRVRADEERRRAEIERDRLKAANERESEGATAGSQPPADRPSPPEALAEQPAPRSAAPTAVPVAPSGTETAAPAPRMAPADDAANRPAAVAAEDSTPRGATVPGGTEDWDVVPVFYGTDRNREPNDKRIDYGAQRAKRLEVGRALVTVPKAHEVPQVERPWAYKLPFTSIVIYEEKEDPKKHFTMKQLQVLTKEQLVAVIRERLRTSETYKDQALVFVHGFNTTFDFAVYRAAQIAYDLKFDGAPFVYSWPSQGKVALQSYSYDRESAEQAEPYLREFLEMVTKETGAKSVSVIAHSMGNQVLLPVLRDLRRAAPEGVQISQVILAAPDVDRDGFEFLAGEIQGVSKGVTLYAHANDRALQVSRQFWGGVPRAGDVPESGPVIISGIDTIDVTSTSTDIFALNHSGYAENTALLNDIELLLKTGERPPEKRIPILKRVTTDKGDFWRYP